MSIPPGPWRCDGFQWVLSADRVCVATVYGDDAARAIALLPEMVELLRDCVFVMESTRDMTDAGVLGEVRALLAKLEGK